MFDEIQYVINVICLCKETFSNSMILGQIEILWIKKCIIMFNHILMNRWNDT